MFLAKKNVTFYIVALAVIIISSFFFLPAKAQAVSILSPGDIYILTVNADSSYPGGANSNGFDFVSRVDLDAGAQIYFADKGWDGSLGTPFWRNTIGEGALRYTVPVGGIAAGTIVRYDDNDISALPTSGSALWDMYTIDPTTGAMTLTTTIANGFDPAVSGDNILVFQGTGASPTFLYGIGWAIGTSWISTGTPSSNNSYIPSGISTAANTVVTLGTSDNYQYNCSNIGMFSSTFAQDVRTAANWNVNDITPFGASSCVFDVTQPSATIDEASGQDDPTNNSTIVFEIVFSNAITPASFTSSDIVLSGTGSATISSLTTLDNITWTLTLSATSNGTIVASLPANTVTELVGANLNLAAVAIDNSVLYDTLAPATLGAPDLTTATDSGSSSSDNITNSTTQTFIGSCVDGDTIEFIVDASPIAPTQICSGGSYSFSINQPEGNYDVGVRAYDPAGNVSADSSTLNFTVDFTAPACIADFSNPTFDLSPELGGTTSSASDTVSLDIDGNTYSPVVDGAASWLLAQGAISPALVAGNTYLVDVTCSDIAGNQTDITSDITALTHVDLNLDVQLNTSGKIVNGDVVTYSFDVTNTDSIESFDVEELQYFHILPTQLDVGVAPGNIVPTTNPDIECVYLGDAQDIGDPAFTQYGTAGVIVCGFVGTDPILPGEAFSYSISFTANVDFVNGVTYKAMIFDDNAIDLDSDVIFNAAALGSDFFSLAVNNVDSAIYNYLEPITTTTTTIVIPPRVAQSGANLPVTGVSQAIYLLWLGFGSLLAGLILRHRSKKRIFFK